jgi:gamma-glutamyl-gamma-aminobutyrate hydrolase PuuD
VGRDVSRPVIGITTYCEQARWGVWDRLADVQLTLYSDAVAASGGAVVLVPPVAAGVADVVGALDGLIVSGGADVDPVHYAQPAHEAAGPFRPDRDDAELALVRTAVARRLPLLGICRGMQVLNVALGGTLSQHLPDRAGTLAHQGPEPGVFTSRTVKLEADSWLGRAIGDEAATACHHHQAVDRLGDGLRVVARADDGTVEAVETVDGSPIAGVQWHPEQLVDRRIFEAFVARCVPG